MRPSRLTNPENETSRVRSTLAKTLAPEEIRRGDFVTLLDVTYEVPSNFWDADAVTLPRDQPVRIRCMPERGGVPLKVQGVCLPFVLVKEPRGAEHARRAQVPPGQTGQVVCRRRLEGVQKGAIETRTQVVGRVVQAGSVRGSLARMPRLP